jgi:broad specificity phosphatase PhoE
VTNLYLVRHGQTALNLENKIQGQIDAYGLDATGCAQIERLGERLRQGDLKCDALLSSPLKRAAETTAAAAEAFEQKIVFHDDLKEIHCGTCEGIEIGEVEAMVFDPPLSFPNAQNGELLKAGTGKELRALYHSSDYSCDNVAHPGGETKAAARSRARHVIEDFLEKNPDKKDVWVVTHSTIIKLLLMAFAPEQSVGKVDCADVLHFVHISGNWRYVGKIEG